VPFFRKKNIASLGTGNTVREMHTVQSDFVRRQIKVGKNISGVRDYNHN